MSNLLVVSIFAVITLALVLWFFLRLDKEKQVSERYYDALQNLQVELRNVQFEKDRLTNKNLALEKEMDYQAKKFDILKIEANKLLEIKRTLEGQEFLVRDKKTGRFVKVSK
jgi:ABC-type phosphate transport system auxiliary subunit